MLETRRDEKVLTVHLNAPAQGNRLSNDAAAQFASSLRCLTDEHMVLVTAAGADFCLGRHMPLPDASNPQSAMQVREGNAEPALDLIRAIRTCPVPVVVAVQGRATGFGCSIAGAGDITLATDDARFQLPEIEHGFAPTLAMSALVNRVGYRALLALVLGRGQLSAEQAERCGLVTEVVQGDGLASAIGRWVTSLSSAKRPAVCDTKRFLNLAYRLEPEASSALAASMLATLISSRT